MSDARTVRHRRGERRTLLLLALAAALASGAALAVRSMPSAPAAAHEPAPGADPPGISENLGGRLPGDIRVLDEDGAAGDMAAFSDVPAILALVYYSCGHMCPQVLGALSQLAFDLPLRPGRDYRILTASFDEADRPEDAAAAKKNYLLPLGPRFPAGSWSFLVAPSGDIVRMTGSLGFHYIKEPHGFVHPSVLVILGPGGFISSYVHVTRTAYGVGYPVTFNAPAIASALRRAAAGKIGPADPAPLLFCYPHEPAGQARFYRLMSALGAGTLILLAGLFVFLAARGGRPEGRAGEG